MWKPALNMAPNDASFPVVQGVNALHSHDMTIRIQGTAKHSVEGFLTAPIAKYRERK